MQSPMNTKWFFTPEKKFKKKKLTQENVLSFHNVETKTLSMRGLCVLQQQSN
jgi:hypothetical protein